MMSEVSSAGSCGATGEPVRVASLDGTRISVRLWSPSHGKPATDLILLHGVVSHSGWMAPIAERIAEAGHRVICPDRRGVALSEGRPGDASDPKVLFRDVEAIVDAFSCEDRPLHFGGFCWGGTYAINFLEATSTPVDSLVLVAPSIFPHPEVGARELETGEDGKARLIPNVPLDRFTRGAEHRDSITSDPLRTRRVSPRFNRTLVEMNRLLGPRWAKLPVPTLMVQASDDQLSDVAKHQRAFQRLRAEPRREVTLSGGHGLQFDAPAETASVVCAWVDARSSSAEPSLPPATTET